MFWNNIRTIIEGLDKSYEREYAKFDEYSDVEGLCDFKDLVVSLRDIDILIEFDKLAHYIIDDRNFKTEPFLHSKISNEFLTMANEKLSSSVIPIYYEPIRGFVTFENIEALLMLINFNYFYYCNMNCSRVKSIEKVFGGNIIQYLSFFTNDFIKSMQDLPDYDDSFFDDLKSVHYEDERARLLEDFLRCGYLSLIVVEQNISWAFFNNIKSSTIHLMACNALKRGSLKVNCEDVVVGYTLTLKLITEDIGKYVRQAFYKVNE